MRRRKHWGWGYEDDAWSAAQLRAAAPGLEEHLRIAGGEVEHAVALEDVVLPAPGVAPAAALDAICSSDVYSRASHAWGKSYCDVVRGFRGRFDFPPDLVARPRGERDVEAVLEWAAGANVAVIPYGGGTSVSGGVQCEVPGRFDGTVSLDLGAMDRVLQIDDVSRAACIQAGAIGPVLEQQLRALDLTLRFYPQSFELSTLGGWIATRAGGHFATVETHIDDLVESLRAVTPSGAWQSRRLPSSGAGISPDRMLLGSEGILGIITEAWVRVRPRPQAHSLAAVRFGDLADGIDALRAIAQSGLRPSNCRLIDAEEARMTGAADGTAALLVLGFEGARQALAPVGELLDRALRCAPRRAASGTTAPSAGRAGRATKPTAATRSAPGAPRSSARPTCATRSSRWGSCSETFETAITWERFAALHAAVTAAARRGDRARWAHNVPYLARLSRRAGAVLHACSRPRAAARNSSSGRRSSRPRRTPCSPPAGRSPTTTPSGATSGRWYDRQRPQPFAAALRAAKQAVDPAGLLNPGVLIDSE